MRIVKNVDWVVGSTKKQTNDERLIGFEDNSKVGGERGTAVVE